MSSYLYLMGLLVIALCLAIVSCGKVEHSGEVTVKLDPKVEAYIRAQCAKEVPAEYVEDCVNAAMAEFIGGF